MLETVTKSMRSVRTTVLGVCAGLLVVIPQFIALLDADDTTIFSFKILLSGLAVMGIGVAAKDGDKSTEDVK